MRNLNEIIIIDGNLGEDAEIVTFDNGGKIAKLSVAVNKSYKKKNGEKVEVTNWWKVEVPSYMESVYPYLKKGKRVKIAGGMDIKQVKEKFYYTLKAETVTLAGSKSDQSDPTRDEGDLPF